MRVVGEVPACPAVYFLSHALRGIGYVGSSRKVSARVKVWRKRLECAEFDVRADCVSDHFFQAARGSRPDEWSFVVLAQFPMMVSLEELRVFEFAYARCLYRLSPNGCLNVRRDNHERFFHHCAEDQYSAHLRVGAVDRRFRGRLMPSDFSDLEE